MSTSKLPALRRYLYLSTILCSVGNAICSFIVLLFQATKTRSFQTEIPILFFSSIVAALGGIGALTLKDGAFGIRYHRLIRFLRSISLEISFFAGIALVFCMAAASLVHSTPGLYSSCGDYLICRLLASVLSLSWITFCMLTLSSSCILLATLYHTIKRKNNLRLTQLLRMPFEDFDWGVYESKSVVAPRRKGDSMIIGLERKGSLAERGAAMGREVRLEIHHEPDYRFTLPEMELLDMQAQFAHQEEEAGKEFKKELNRKVEGRDEVGNVRAFDCRG